MCAEETIVSQSGRQEDDFGGYNNNPGEKEQWLRLWGKQRK